MALWVAAIFASMLAMAAASPAVASPSIGTVSVVADGFSGRPTGIAAGPDGAMWFANYGDSGSIGRVTMSGEVTTYAVPEGAYPQEITAGPDGNMYFTMPGLQSIGRITMAGAVTTVRDVSPGGPTGITAWGGDVWFTNQSANTIERLGLQGGPSQVSLSPGSMPQGIAAGPDGALWFTEVGTKAVGRLTAAGTVTTFPLGLFASQPTAIVAGSDGAMWFTVSGWSRIGRITMDGAITLTGIGEQGIDTPRAIAAAPDGALWFTQNNSIGRIYRSGVPGGFQSQTIRTLAAPTGLGIAAGPDGNMYFTGGDHAVLRVRPAPPTAPVAVFARPSTTSAVISWADPSAGDASPITRYTVTAAPGGATCSWSEGPLGCWILGLTPGTAYTFTVTATSAYGTSEPSLPSDPVTPTPPPQGGGFHALAPARLLDSRTGSGGWTGPLVAGTDRTLTVTGTAIPTSASAVVLNVTATEATAGSFLTMFPWGTGVPATSNLNFAAGQTIAALATVPVGVDGKVVFANAVGSTHLIVDVVGYYDAEWLVEVGDRFHATDPTRVLDSRTGAGGWSGPLPAGDAAARRVHVAGANGVPANATAVAMNLTVTGGTANSFVRVWPAGSSPPITSNLNFASGQTIANLVMTQIGTGGDVSVFNAAGSVDVVADVVGYFTPGPGGSLFHTVESPRRILDDRDGTGLSGPWTEAQVRSFIATSATDVPASATAIVTTITVTNGTAGTFVTAFPTGGPVPTASTINAPPGTTIANHTITRLGSDGQLSVFNAAGSIDVIADAVGFFTPEELWAQPPASLRSTRRD